MSQADTTMSFWDHLDALRTVLLRVVVVVVVLCIAMFFLKEPLFDIVLAPSRSDFVLFRGINWLGEWLGIDGMATQDFQPLLINTRLTGQFMAHLQVSFYAALILAVPFVTWQVFTFVAPALYVNERRNVTLALGWGQVLFAVGILLNYFLIFPLSCRFLFLYEVSSAVQNMIDLTSYLDTLLLLTIMMGIMFELPLVCLLLARMGIITHQLMRRYRRHSILAIVTIAAIITPTTDVFTLLLVALPIYLLYEVSIVTIRLRKQ